MSKFKLALGAATLFAASAASAGASVDVTYDLSLGGSAFGAGAFSGTDANNDGLITFAELSAFSFDSFNGVYHVVLADLNDTGSYNIGTNIWNADGQSWVGSGNIAYFTFGNFVYSANTTNSTVTTFGVTAVPEPGAWAMMGLGLLVLGARRRKA